MKNILSLGIILLAAAISHAQVVPKPPVRYKFYVAGAHGYTKHEIFYKSPSVYPNSTTIGPWKPTVGVNFNERFSIEISRWRDIEDNEYKMSASGTKLDGTPVREYTGSYSYSRGIPLTGRYAFTRSTSNRLKLEVIGGISYVTTKASLEERRIEGEEEVSYEFVSAQSSNLYVSAGLGGRFQLGKHLEIVGDYGFNRILRNVDGATHRQIIGNPTGLTRNRSIGLRYRFNFKINKPTPKEDAAE
ncbi:outer membrane beta-barrel protein [Hymenobacter sediminicola]|uniref:Outer membrane beta-barrel protein n=1 Tax=Hymenobacter sediminicola TaxID=2761579 RepID=A0A7G7WAG8_9BACT|nr:outer membrane beta-barrel protein [Hymenobacter sediminicola]QNH63361.1 outer membrane beta-barrel protein [Hymenobacter sediminicola]